MPRRRPPPTAALPAPPPAQALTTATGRRPYAPPSLTGSRRERILCQSARLRKSRLEFGRRLHLARCRQREVHAQVAGVVEVRPQPAPHRRRELARDREPQPHTARGG